MHEPLALTLGLSGDNPARKRKPNEELAHMKTELLNIDQNPKTVKGRAQGFVTAVLYLSPSDSSGAQLCPTAELAGCAVTCLNTAGRGGMSAGNATFRTDSGVELPDNAIQRARLRRTRLFLDDQPAFMARLVREIERAQVFAAKLDKTLVVRPNGTSDIRWENVPCVRDGVEYPHIFAAFPDVQFYDYTKIPNRRVFHIPNYSLTFSYSHVSGFAPIVIKALKHYGSRVNFAVVFHGKMPSAFLGRDVINGDESDLRFLDRPGVVVALKAKGKARKDTSGFVVRIAA